VYDEGSADSGDEPTLLYDEGSAHSGDQRTLVYDEGSASEGSALSRHCENSSGDEWIRRTSRVLRSTNSAGKRLLTSTADSRFRVFLVSKLSEGFIISTH
jgi:hypothetical protein